MQRFTDSSREASALGDGGVFRLAPSVRLGGLRRARPKLEPDFHAAMRDDDLFDA